MSGNKPYWVVGEIKILIPHAGEAFVRVPNGNVYPINTLTPGLDFLQLVVGMKVEIEITGRLDKVYSARIITIAE